MPRNLFNVCSYIVSRLGINSDFINKQKFIKKSLVDNSLFFKQALTNFSIAKFINFSLLDGTFFTLSTGPINTIKFNNILLIKGSVLWN